MPSKTKSSRPRLSTPLSRKIQMLQQRCADILNQKTGTGPRETKVFPLHCLYGYEVALSLWGLYLLIMLILSEAGPLQQLFLPPGRR